MILHIPHSSQTIPSNLRDQIVLSNAELGAELGRMTDAFTDELFDFNNAVKIIHPVSRLVVDVERFPDDADEPMAKKGMGMIYRRTSGGDILRRDLSSEERAYLKTQYYERHHRALTKAVAGELAENGGSLIVDCHSFPETPLPSDDDHTTPRPDFCVGTDSFHTPEFLADAALGAIQLVGCNAWINRPFAGSIVPMAYYRKDARVMSIMIEVNRRLYMNEDLEERAAGYVDTRNAIRVLLAVLNFAFFRHLSEIQG